MSLPAIEVSGLSKRYVIEHESRHDTLRDTLHHTARKLWRRFRWGTGFQREEFWALRDVSFSVQPGEVVGIIGRNGAGKSTLLKILSRITEPTAGKITLRGRVASLLEVGTGFHPDLTGRENIFLNGAILGMRRAEIRQKFDEIVAFAEIEKFLDTPVKRYSSGMYVRLAFAVAAHLEPEILIIDEVLAVGDAQFQDRCLGKMRQVASSGRTVLFVSHNLSAIRTLCTSAILLQRGQCVSQGTVAAVMARYISPSPNGLVHYQGAASPVEHPCVAWANVQTSSSESRHEAAQSLMIELGVRTAGNPNVVVGLHVYDAQLNQVIQSSSLFAPVAYPRGLGEAGLRITIPARTLNVGTYRCSFVVAEQNRAIFEKLDYVLDFTVVDSAFPGPGEANDWGGACSPLLLDWSWQK